MRGKIQLSINKYEINIYEQIARNIKKYRKEAGITQAELAEKIGVSHEFIRRNESKKGKKSFSVDTIWKISIALDIQPGKLFEIDLDELVQQ
jgi:transcriptional regulator with XRE-family HTH domain